MRLVSLGQACEVAFEIKIHSPKADSDFFDWLITPFDGLMMALNGEFKDLLNPEDLYLQDDKNFVNNRRTGIQYGHVFLRDDFHNIPDAFLDDLDRVQSKFDYLIEKFHSYKQGGEQICFVRRSVDSSQAVILHDRLIEIFPALDFKIACVNAADLGISSLPSSRFIDLRVVDGGPDGLGYPEEWANALVLAGLTDQPFVKSKDDIVIPFH